MAIVNAWYTQSGQTADFDTHQDFGVLNKYGRNISGRAFVSYKRESMGESTVTTIHERQVNHERQGNLFFSQISSQQAHQGNLIADASLVQASYQVAVDIGMARNLAPGQYLEKTNNQMVTAAPSGYWNTQRPSIYSQMPELIPYASKYFRGQQVHERHANPQLRTDGNLPMFDKMGLQVLDKRGTPQGVWAFKINLTPQQERHIQDSWKAEIKAKINERLAAEGVREVQPRLWAKDSEFYTHIRIAGIVMDVMESVDGVKPIHYDAALPHREILEKWSNKTIEEAIGVPRTTLSRERTAARDAALQHGQSSSHRPPGPALAR